jgi:hypothetical protein
VPLDLLGGLAVKNKADGVLSVLPNLSSDIIAVLEFVHETLAGVIKEETTNTAESFSSQKFDLGVRFLGVDKTCGVNLNLLEVDSTSTNGKSKLLTITSAVLAIGSRKIPELWTVLLEEGIFGEVGGISTGSEDDGAVSGAGLSCMCVLNTNHSARLILNELDNASLLQDLDALRITNGKIFEALQLSVGDNHSGELSISTVSAGLTVTAETCDLGEI